MTSLLDLDAMYLQEKVQVTIHEVKSSYFKEFHKSFRAFKSKVGEQYSSSYWELFRHNCSRYRNEHLKVPIGLQNTGSLQLDFVEKLVQEYSNIHNIYPSVSLDFERVMNGLSRCLAENSNPLLTGLKEKFPEFDLDVKGGRVFVLTDNSNYELVEDQFKLSFPQINDWSKCIYTARQLKRQFLDGELIVFGNPSNMLYLNQDWLLKSPRAFAYNFLTFDFVNGSWELPVAFPSVNSTKLLERSVSRSNYDDHVTLSYPPADESVEEFYSDSDFEYSQEDIEVAKFTDEELEKNEIVEGRLLTLEGGWKVWVDADTSATFLCIDLESQSRVRDINSRDAEIGTFYLYREGDKDFIPGVANDILGPSHINLRIIQHEWKMKLRSRVVGLGVERVVSKLKENGSQLANDVNLRNWISDRNICTQYKEDFTAIMRYLRENHSDEIWNQMGQIRTAHSKAGRLVKRELVRSITSSENLEQLLSDGWEEFHLGIGKSDKLIAREILEVSKDTHIINESEVGLVEKLSR